VHANTSTPGTDRAERGFTLIELMVVVAIVAILVVVAVLSMSPAKHARSTVGFTEELASTLEGMRVRAVATRKWQRLEVNAGSATHYEATVEGMATPTDWYSVQAVQAPDGVFVYAVDDEPHVAVDTDVPDEGTGLGVTMIDFAPDGAGTAATIFVGDQAGERRLRIVIFPATGAAYVFEEW